ncbi:hypothetical protein [Flavobacterium sp.]|mgnify:CR=1 FL=1|uniref:hypothetical protein n=1 Tax=Flavobacterium sp. TaxID=239 RepID=UPI002FDE9213
MKNIYALVTLLFLCQSCFTYKTIHNDPYQLEAGKTYKVKHDHKVSKIVFYSVNDSTMQVVEQFEKREIPVKDITEIQKRKFSIVKTVGLPLSVAAGLVGLFALTYH